ILTSGGVSYIHRARPMPYGDLLTQGNVNTWLYATKITRAVPAGAPTDGNWKYTPGGELPENARYKFAVLTVIFESLDYDILKDSQIIGASAVPDESTLNRYVVKNPQPAADYLSLPGGGFNYVSNQGAVPGRPGKIIPTHDIALTWKK